MSIIIELLSEADLESVDDLSRRYRNTVGFLTSETFRDYLNKGGVLGARTESGHLAGYLLFARYPDRFRIAQLCVSNEHRERGMARRLIDALKASATTQKIIKLRCRRDFPAHAVWNKLGFIPLDEKPGRSSKGHLLTLWCYRLISDDELGLWKAEASDEVLDIVVDAQIFYDFSAEDTPNTLISKGLLHDSLLDSLNLWITDELFLEIDRNSCDEVRRRSRERAHGMAKLPHSQDQAKQYYDILKGLLPYRTPSEQSDLHQLAKTAASAVKIFATKDEKLLKKTDAIKGLTGVSIIHPTEIITSLHEISEKHSYSPSRVSGLNLHWIRMREEDCTRLPAHSFQKHGESRGKFIETIRAFLANPRRYRCEMLNSDSNTVAIRVLHVSESGILQIHFARVSNNSETKLFSDYLVADTLSLSVENGCTAVVFVNQEELGYMRPSFIGMGFKPCRNGLARVILPKACRRDEALTQIAAQFPELSSQYRELTDLDFDRDCAPLLSNEALPSYVIPIRPGFAMGLLDTKQAANDFFGGNPSILLRWDNVYYRRSSHHRMLKAPGRIFWYASRSVGAIIAVSHLDEIDIGLPKDLFRKYRRFGILEWRDIYNMCEKNIEQPLMALRFSRTFLFKMQISLTALRAVLAKDGISESLQAPSIIPFQTAKNLYEIGFSQPS